MPFNARLLCLTLLSYVVSIWGQQQQFVPIYLTNQSPQANPATASPWQQAPLWTNALSGAYPAPSQYIAENPNPAHTAGGVPDPITHAGGVALNLVVNAGPGSSPAPAFSSAPASNQAQLPISTPAGSSAQSQPAGLATAGDHSRSDPNGEKASPARKNDLPDQIVIDGHSYKLNDGETLVVQEKEKRKRHDDDDRKHRHDDDDEDRHRHTERDRKDDDNEKKSRKKSDDSDDDKSKKKVDSKPKKPIAKLPELPSTPEIPSVPTLQTQANLEPTKPPIYPGENVELAKVIAATTNTSAPIPSPAAAVEAINPVNGPEVIKASPVQTGSGTHQEPTSTIREQAAVAAISPDAVKLQVNGTEASTDPSIMTTEMGGALQVPNPDSVSGSQPMIQVATLAPLSLPQNPGQWASPLPRDQRFETAKATLATHPDQRAGSATSARPGQMPDLPNLPPGMQSFHQRPDAVKKPPSPPSAPMPKPMMPKSKAGSLNNSNPLAVPGTKTPNVPPVVTAPGVGSVANKSTAHRPEPVPAILVPEATPTVVDTPAPTIAPTPSPDPTPEPKKKSKWAFGHGPEYNYEPSTGRKPSDQTNGDPFGKKNNDKEQPDDKGKKKKDGKKKGEDGKKSKDAKPAASGSADQNKAVTDMFSNIMGKIKFK